MKKFQERMDEIKVESYKDCVWYLEDIDKCKMCDAHAINFSCHCKEEMDDFCIWITKFFGISNNEEINEEDESIAEPYLSFNNEEENKEASFQTILDALM